MSEASIERLEDDLHGADGLVRSIPSILVVDGQSEVLQELEDLLAEEGFEVEVTRSVDEALRLLRDRDFGMILADPRMTGEQGPGLIARIRALRPQTPVVAMTDSDRIQSGIEAIRAGAFDCVTRPRDGRQRGELTLVLERALRHRTLEEENQLLRQAIDRTASFGDLVGRSRAMQDVQAAIRGITNPRSHVLVTGEPGTGKELIARTIHFSGARKDRPFVPVRCGAMSEAALESELFGRAGSERPEDSVSRKGAIEVAEGGTLFLDEVDQMPASVQEKLLRALQDRAVRIDGDGREIAVDVRIIASSPASLEEAIREGRFRESLFHHLNAIPIQVPPLRSRSEDIPVLAEAFLRRHAGDGRHQLSSAARQRLSAHHWPGNARELESCIEQALSLARSNEIGEADLVFATDPHDPDEAFGALHQQLIQLALQREISAHDLNEAYIDAALEAAEGRKSLAARMLGMNRRTLYRREERLARRQAEAASATPTPDRPAAMSKALPKVAGARTSVA